MVGDAKVELLHSSSIYILPSYNEGLPMSVLEAMACGLCVISTNVGGIPYMLKHEYDALLVPSDDDTLMAKAVRRFLTEDGLAERLSGNSRQKVEQFDWSNILAKWESLLSDVARNQNHG